jgi:hypothetical protein
LLLYRCQNLWRGKVRVYNDQQPGVCVRVSLSSPMHVVFVIYAPNGLVPPAYVPRANSSLNVLLDTLHEFDDTALGVNRRESVPLCESSQEPCFAPMKPTFLPVQLVQPLTILLGVRFALALLPLYVKNSLKLSFEPHELLPA